MSSSNWRMAPPNQPQPTPEPGNDYYFYFINYCFY